MIPYQFTGLYDRCYGQRDNCVDERHVYLVHDILVASDFANSLEIGAADGACTTAFVESLKRTTGHIWINDIECTDTALRVLGNAIDVSRATYLPGDCCKILAGGDPFDFVFVDGFHDMQSVEPQVAELLRRRPLCIMAHDVSSHANGYRKSDGAAWLRQKLESCPPYAGRCLVDDERRDGEETHRGLFMATSSDSIFGVCAELFDKWRAWKQVGAMA